MERQNAKIDANDFRRRRKRQRGEDQKFREIGGDDSGEGWRYGKGDYGVSYLDFEFGTAPLTGIDLEFRGSRGEVLHGAETSIQKMIEELLLKSEKRPIIVFDFGGGLGLSWCRLARHFEREVLSGDVMFVVSNIERYYSVFGAACSENLRVTEPERRLVFDAYNRKLVHYIEAELLGADRGKLRSLRQYKVNIGNKMVPLIGNIDIVHTRWSLVHSEIPEFHYPRLFELLSEQGIFVDTTFNSKIPAVRADREETNWFLGDKAKYIFEAYKYVMAEMGFELVAEADGGKEKGKKLWATVLRRKGLGWPRVVVD